MNDNKGRQVLRESEWMTVYKLEGGVSLHESKFLVQGLVVNARSIKARWQHFSQEEKYDFVRAYQAKAEVTPEDEEILRFSSPVASSKEWRWRGRLLSIRRL